MSDEGRVTALLDMYQQYRLVHQQIAAATHRLAKAKLRHQPIEPIQREIDTLQSQQDKIADAMTFDTPIVWMLYKYRAYANEPQPIRTMHDFRMHCSKPDYICTKRFTFVNHMLRQHDHMPLSDTSAYPDTTPLKDVAVSPPVQLLVADAAIMRQWRAHEYFTRDDRVAKWQNFADPDPES